MNRFKGGDMVQISHRVLEPTFDILRLAEQPIEALLKPETVAVIGASNQVGTAGYSLVWNLVNAPFHGTVYLVSSSSDILGMPTYGSLKELPEAIDLAIVVAALPETPAILQDCIAMGVRTALLVSSGFRESGAVVLPIWQHLQQLVKASPLRLLGPNSLGIMHPRHGLNATLASAMASPGNIGFVTQSGALSRAILNWSFQEKVGFSAFISMGSMLDLDWGDVLRYLGNDPQTQSIIIHMETIGNAQSFLTVAREIARSKPIILLKGGRTDAAVKASLAHTGETLGNDDVFEAALRRCGVLRVNRISELFNMAEVLAKRDYLITGSRLSIVTNSGGLGVLATDALVLTGGKLAPLAPATVARLNHILPPEWSGQNPIDILGDADGERFQKVIEVAVEDPNADGLLVIFTPQGVADPTDTAERLRDIVNRLQDTPYGHKPILASWMGGAEVMAGEAILNRHQIPTYPYPDSAARLFNLMSQHSYSLQGMAELPTMQPPDAKTLPDRALAADMIQSARQRGRRVLSAVEALKLLEAYHLPVLQTAIAASEEEAIGQAETMGYPVVLKLPYIPGVHTADEGGVQLNLTNSEAVRHAFRTLLDQSPQAMEVLVQPMVVRDGAYELMLCSFVDSHFGPVVSFGKGGRLQEVYQDRQVALPPLNVALARRTMEQTQIFEALRGQRGYAAVDLEALSNLLVTFSQLVVDQPQIKGININPLWVQPDWQLLTPETRHRLERTGTQLQPLLILDARIELYPAPESTTDQPPKQPWPILRPYPVDLVSKFSLEGRTVTIRPARPEDEASIMAFQTGLSNQSVYLRHSQLLTLGFRETQQRLQQLCYLDYDHELALVAEGTAPTTRQKAILAIARFNQDIDSHTADFALVVEDTIQGHGLGTAMVRQLVRFARDRSVTTLTTNVLPDNAAMQRVCEKVGFTLHRVGEYIRATLVIEP
jgi:acetyltransferase